MGRPPLGAVAMTPAQREQRRRDKGKEERLLLSRALLAAMKDWKDGKDQLGFFYQHFAAIKTARAYAAQRKE